MSIVTNKPPPTLDILTRVHELISTLYDKTDRADYNLLNVSVKMEIDWNIDDILWDIKEYEESVCMDVLGKINSNDLYNWIYDAKKW